MSADVVFLVSLLTPFISLIAVLLTVITMHRTQHVADRVQSLDVKVDGRLSQLLAATAQAAMGEGHAAGRAEVKEEVSTGAIAPLPTPTDTVKVQTTTIHTETT